MQRFGELSRLFDPTRCCKCIFFMSRLLLLRILVRFRLGDNVEVTILVHICSCDAQVIS